MPWPRGEVLAVLFDEMQGQYAVAAFERRGAREALGVALHERPRQRAFQFGVGQMDGRGARHAVPVPALLHESARRGRDGIARTDDRRRTVALVASVAVVLGINLRSPDIGVECFERHHPVAAAVDARGPVVIDEESRGRGTCRNPLFPEEAVQLLVRAFQAQVGARQFGVRALPLPVRSPSAAR